MSRWFAAITLPVSWMWIIHASLDGMGPTPEDALATLAATNTAESLTALHLAINSKSLLVALLQLGLLCSSFASGLPETNGRSRVLVAASLMIVMLNAWAPRLLAHPPSFLPGRDDLQNSPYGSMADLFSVWADTGRERGTARAMRRRPSEPRVEHDINAIFVLGETFRFERAAGAEKRTVSLLDQRAVAGLGAVLPKVCASADATAISVPMLLTGTAPERHEQAATAPSGLARLAAAGYETAWISNQGEVFFADERRDLTWIARGYANQYDDAVLPVVSQVLSRKHQVNKAILIHLMDSHAAYEERYPAMPEPDGIDEERRDALRYTRATDHTISVLSRLATMIDGVAVPTFAVYVADHGENLLSDRNGIRFHAGARTTAKAGYVPSFVFWNAAFAREFRPEERIKEYLSSATLAHVDIFNLWMSFAGIAADLTSTSEPKILGKAHLTDPVGAIPCASLLP